MTLVDGGRLHFYGLIFTFLLLGFNKFGSSLAVHLDKNMSHIAIVFTIYSQSQH